MVSKACVEWQGRVVRRRTVTGWSGRSCSSESGLGQRYKQQSVYAGSKSGSLNGRRLHHRADHHLRTRVHRLRVM